MNLSINWMDLQGETLKEKNESLLQIVEALGAAMGGAERVIASETIIDTLMVAGLSRYEPCRPEDDGVLVLSGLIKGKPTADGGRTCTLLYKNEDAKTHDILIHGMSGELADLQLKNFYY